MGACSAVFGCLVLLVILVVAVSASRGRHRGRDHFFTLHGQEEPTRSYTPYTGEIPYGPWGTLPWAEAAPLPTSGFGCRPHPARRVLPEPAPSQRDRAFVAGVAKMLAEQRDEEAAALLAPVSTTQDPWDSSLEGEALGAPAFHYDPLAHIYTDPDPALKSPFVGPRCRVCRGSRSYHESIQKARPHAFLAGPPETLLPSEMGPHYEGGTPLTN